MRHRKEKGEKMSPVYIIKNGENTTCLFVLTCPAPLYVQLGVKAKCYIQIQPIKKKKQNMKW